MLCEKKNNVTAKIDGMHCEKCVAKVEAALKGIGVKSKIDLKLGRAELIYPAKLDINTIKETIQALGFSIEV